VFSRRLAQKSGDPFPQINQTPDAFHKLQADYLVDARYDQIADRLPQALNRQRDVVADDVRTADAQFGPISWLGQGGRASARVLTAFGPLISVQLFARLFKLQEKLVRLAQKFGDQLCRSALAQCGEETLVGARVPEPLQREAHLGTGDTDADVPRSDPLDAVGFVEDDEVVLEQNAALNLVVQTAQQRT